MSKFPELETKSEAELEAMIANHRAKQATDRPVFTALLAEHARRKGQGLVFEKSIRVIEAAARAGRYVGYKELAEESGAEWSKVHWSVGPHLDKMLEYCFHRKLPLLPAIVVRTDEVASGKLRGSSLEGFIKGCAGLGIEVPSDHEAFADTEQVRVFEWARKGASL